jgi:hypothetical protein
MPEKLRSEQISCEPRLTLNAEAALWLRALRASEAAGQVSKYDADEARLTLRLAAESAFRSGRAVKPEGPGFVDQAPTPYIVSTPSKWVVSGPDFRVELEDHVVAPMLYEGFLRSKGVRHYGPRIREISLDDWISLTERAGLGRKEAQVLRLVSELEGGFESLNTYDTGGVSVGLIQFASLLKGTGSLAELLLDFKSRDPKQFEEYFGRYGIGAEAELGMLAQDDYGAWVHGPAAVELIADDPVRAAVFIRAGRLSEAFRMAQMRLAIRMYYPAERIVRLSIGGKDVFCQIGSIVKSEAGLANLMEAFVHKGSFRRFVDAVNRVVERRGVKKIESLGMYEHEILDMCIHRRDFRAMP